MAIPQQAQDLQKKIQGVVLVSMRIMYDPKMRQTLLNGIKSQMPLPQKLAIEVSGVLKIVDQRTKNGLTPDILVPAAVVLMYEYALFMKQAGLGNPGPDDIKAALPILQQLLVKVFAEGGKAVMRQVQPNAQPATQSQQPAPQQPAGGLIAQPAGA